MSQRGVGSMPSYQGPPPAAPPSYSEAVRGVPPSSPFTPGQLAKHHRPLKHEQPVIVTTVVPVSGQSTHMICPECSAEIETITRVKPGLLAYLSGFIIALLGCFCGCCLIPCCVDSCMVVQHSCPKCNNPIARYNK